MYENAMVYVSEQATEGTFLLSTAAKEFEAQLSDRTKVPAHKLKIYPKKTEAQVLDETEAVEGILKRFSGAVVDAMDKPRFASSFLADLDLKSISRDHNWRRIFAIIAAQEEAFESHKRIMLVKYLQYLNTRKRLLEYIYAQKCGLEETSAHDMTNVPSAPTVGMDQEATHFKPVPNTEFVRLPLGETVEIELAETGTTEMMFASHMHRLIGRSQPCLVDQNGVTHFIKQGRNMVGRHPESDVVIDPNFHDISRAHMVLEWDGGNSVRVTDLSTRGTYLPMKAADRVSRVEIALQ